MSEPLDKPVTNAQATGKEPVGKAQKPVAKPVDKAEKPVASNESKPVATVEKPDASSPTTPEPDTNLTPPAPAGVHAHAAGFERKLVCLEDGAYVFLYSSYGSFETRETGLPVVKKEEVEGKSARLI